MDKNDNFEFKNFNSGKQTISRFKGWGLFLAIFWAFFFALVLSNIISPYFSQILNGLLNGITPLLIGIVVAFIFARLIDFIERVLLKNAFKTSPYKFGLKRTISITACLLILVGIFALVFSILVPKIIEIIQRLTAGGGDGTTELINNVVNEICAIIQKWFGAEVSQESIKDILNYAFESLMSAVGYLNNLMELSMNLVSGIFNFIIGILISIFIMKDKEKISRYVRRFTYANFKKERADELCVVTKNASDILHNYVICKIIEFAIIFFSLGFTYVLLGLEFTWELSLIVGLFNFIPYFGIYIGAFVAVLITLIFNSINSALYLLIATLVITTIEFNLIVPFITGKKLKVSALVVVGSILVGGAMFGIIGMLLAPPIVALLSAIITSKIELKENHMKYVHELNKARAENEKEEKEMLGVTSSPIIEEKEEKPEEKVIEDNKEITEKPEEKPKKATKKSTLTKKTVKAKTTAKKD